MYQSDDLTLEKFRDDLELRNHPCVIQGIQEKWKQKYDFNFKNLLQDFGEKEMKIAESDNGKKIRIKLKDYMHYLIHQQDDSPLYLFQNCD